MFKGKNLFSNYLYYYHEKSNENRENNISRKFLDYE